MGLFIVVFVGAVIFSQIVLALARMRRRRRRLAYIDTYSWPPGLLKRVTAEHPNLTAADLDRIQQGLRQFFRAYVRGNYRYVAMPSAAADALWHEFILYTKAYAEFCNKAFGRFLHHTPSVVLARGARDSNEGLRRVFTVCCREERINPWKPAAMPLLFNIDKELRFPGGFRYTPDCSALRARGGVGGGYCGGDFASADFDGGTAGFGDSASGGDSSSSDGGGGDGGGDGGGCGGGGGD